MNISFVTTIYKKNTRFDEEIIWNLSFYCIKLNWFSSHCQINNASVWVRVWKRFKYRVFRTKQLLFAQNGKNVSISYYTYTIQYIEDEILSSNALNFENKIKKMKHIFYLCLHFWIAKYIDRFALNFQHLKWW